MLVWKGRKAAFAAMGRISPNYIVQDGVIPRTKLPEVMSEIERMSSACGLRVANVFHAGDGNLHPLVLYDARIPGQEALAEKLSGDILRLCVRVGGSITGEHGVGQEKKEFMPTMYAEPDLDTMQLVRCAFDPEHLSNPTKMFPRLRLCGDKPGPYSSSSARNRGRGPDLLMSTSSPPVEVRWNELESVAPIRPATDADAIDGLVPARVAAPETEEQVSAILAWANEHDVHVIARGGGTKHPGETHRAPPISSSRWRNSIASSITPGRT